MVPSPLDQWYPPPRIDVNSPEEGCRPLGCCSAAMSHQCELGVLEPDNQFNLLINDRRLKSRIADISPVRCLELRSSRKGDTFVRELKLFIACVLAEEDIEGLRESWEEVQGKGTFSYSADAEYDIDFIADELLKKSDIVDLKERYGIQMIR